MNRPLRRLLVGILLFGSLAAFAQSSPITSVPPTAGYPRHETDNQNQIQLTLNAATPIFSCSGAGCAAWSVTLDGTPATITSITVSGTIVLINFSPAVGINQLVEVSYSGADAASINPFGPIQSYNDRPIVCADFAFEAKIGNPPPCAPVKPIDQMVFSVRRGARNSQRWATTTKQVRVFWITNGAAPFSDLTAFESNNVGAPTPNQYFITVDAIPDTYQYPVNDIVCGYSSTWRIKLTVGATVTVCDPTSPNQTIVYASHNTDAQGEGTGQLQLPPTIVNTNLVCLGDTVNMTFSDNTQLNCNAPPPPLPLPPNEEIRWVRVIYGSQDLGGGNGPNNNIPNIIVGGGAGIPVTDASGNLLFPGGYFPVAPMTTTFGNPDINGVVEILRPVNGPRGILELIRTTSPVGQAAGQRFWVRLEYWNICNAYTGDPTVNVRVVENFVEIIDKPLPPIVPDRDVCSTESSQLSVIPALAAHTYRWYSTLANALANTSVLATAATFTPTEIQAPVGATTSFFVTATLGNGCVSEPTQVVLKRRSALSNTGLTINGPANLCPQSSYSFQVNVPPAAGAPAGEPTRYRWEVPAGWTITPADGIAQTVTITTGATTGAGTVTVNYEYSNLTSNNTRCGVTITRTFTVQARPTANITPDPINICEGTALQLNGNPVLPPAVGGFSPVIASHLWGGNTAILDQINVQQPNLLTLAPAGAYAVTYTVAADFGSGVTCSSLPVSQAVNISANPGVATTGPAQPLCQGSLVSDPLGGNTPIFPATGAWSLVSRPLLSVASNANFANQTDPNTTFAGDVNGVYVLRWTITNSACISSSDIIVDFGSPPPAATISTDPDVCGNTVALTGSDPTFASGTWSLVSGLGLATFAPSVNDRNATLEVTQPGTYRIRWLLESGNCDSTQSVTDIIFRQPATIEGPADFITCVDSPPALTFPVTGAFGGGATQARWEVVSGGGTLVSSGSPTGTFSALSPVNDVYTPSVADFTNGSVQLQIITDDPAGACPAVSTAVTVSFDRLPSVISAGPDAATCDPSINLAASAPNNGGTGVWSTGSVLYNESFPASDNGFGLTGPASGVFNHPGSNWSINVPPVSLLNADDWFRVQNRYMEAHDVKNEVVWRSAIVPIAAFPLISVSVEVAAFGVLEPDDYIRAFYRINGGAEILLGQIEGNNVVEGNGGFRNLSLSGLSGNTIEIVVRIRNNENGEYHRFDNILIAGSGATLPTIASVNNPVSNVTNLPEGVTQFVWSVGSALGFCPSSVDVVEITRHPQPQANAIVPGNLCETVIGSGLATAFDLTQYNSAITGGCASCTVDWFTGPGTTNPIGTPTSVNIADGTALVVRVTDSSLTPSCQNINSITFPVNSLPVSINQFPDFCEAVAGTGLATNINLRNFDNALKNNVAANTVTWFTSTMAAVPDPTNVSGTSGTSFIGVIADGNGCTSQADLNVTVNPIPVPNPISGADQVCVDPTTISLFQVTNINAGSTYTWSIPEPPFVKFGGGNINDFFVLLAFPTATSPSLNISVIETSDKGCVGVPNVKTITVDDNPPILAISGPPAVCENETLINFSVPDLAGTTYLWTVPPGASVINGQGTSSVVVNFGALPGLVEVSPTSSTGCAGNPSTLAVSINSRPSLDLLSGNVCSDTPGNITLSGTGANTFNITSVLVPAGLDPPVRPLVSGAPATVIQNDVFTNLTGGDLTVQYTVVPVSVENCTGDPRLVNMVIRPEPVLVPTLADQICSRTEDVSIVLAVATGSAPASAYEIVSINSGGLTQVAGVDALPGPFGASVLLDDRWENLTDAAVEVQYFVRPLSPTGCLGDPAIPVRVIVNPEPMLAAITPNPDVICSGATPTVTFGSNIPGSIFSWVPTTINGIISGATSGNGASITNVLTNGALVQGNVTYQVTPTGPAALGACPGVADNLLVQVDPSPIANNQNLIVCSDDVAGNTNVVDLTLNEPSINSGAVTFAWYQDAALTNPIPTPASFTMINNVPVYVEVNDALCTKVATVLYQVNPTPSVTSAITSNFNGFQVSCNGANDGQITATPANGTFPYQFSIDGGTVFFNTPIFNGLGVSNNPYIITVRDANGCSNAAPPRTLSQPTPVTGIADIKIPYNGQNVSCQNAADGIVEILPSGGAGSSAADYSYRILEVPGNTSGNNNGIYTGLRAGQYTAVITDANNCQFTIPDIVLTEPAPVLATAVLTTPVSCAGQNDGVVTVTGSGGTLVNFYTFTLNQPPGTVNTSGVFGSLTAGSYTATVRDDNGCEQVSNTIFVIEPSVLTAFASVTSNYSGANISCPGANDAQVTAVSNGGNLGGYTFELIQNGSLINAPSSAAFSNLGPSAYTVRVTDTGGCEVTTLPVTVVEPLPIVPTGVVTGDISCHGGDDGRITISASGGTGFYSFTRLPIPGLTNISGVFTGLADGIYDFRVTDLNNCFNDVQVTITEPTPIIASAAVTSNYNGSQISCTGANDGIITVSANGGTGLLRYIFENILTNTTGQFSGVFTGVPASTNNTFRIRDAKNCEVTTVPIDIVQPDPVTGSGSVVSSYNGEDISCFGASDGEISITGAGGTGAYTYRIDQLPLNTSGNTSGLYTGIGQGVYTVTVRDANSCFTVTAPITVTSPAAITTALSVTSNYNGRQISCNGASDGELTINANGGVPAYTYALVGFTGNLPGNVFNSLSASTYTVLVTDANGCTRLSSPVTITEPPVLAASAAITSIYNGINVSCFGASDGQIIVTQTGGTTGYTYELLGSGPPQATGVFNNLLANIPYTFRVTDVNNCVSETLPLTLSEPTALVSQASVTSNYNGSQISCNGVADGIITITTSGGTGIPVNVFDQFDVTNQTGRFSGIFTSIPAGNAYTFTVTDVNGCSVITAPIDVVPPDAITGTSTATSQYNGFNVSCFNFTDGELTIAASGGTGDLNFLLLENPANTSGVSTGIFNDLRAGSYRIRIADANGCLFTSLPTTITQPNDLSVTIDKTSDYNGFDLNCYGSDDGIVSVITASGGAGGYTYEIFHNSLATGNTSGETSGVFNGLVSGLYDINITDVNSCVKKSLPVVLIDPLPLFEGILGLDQAICFNQDTPKPITELSPAFGSIGNYAYQWQSSTDGINFSDVAGATTVSFNPPANLIEKTFYQRIITSGCATGITNAVSVAVNPIPTASLAPSKSPVCEGDFFTMNVEFQNGQAPYYFDFNDGITFVADRIGADLTPIPVVNYTETRTYTITALRDFNGCTATVLPAPVTVPVSKINPNFTIISPTAQCSGGTYEFQWTVDPNVEYTWFWNDGQSEFVAANSRPSGLNTINHDFFSFNTSGNTNIPVILSAINNVDGCGPKQATRSITIYPNIIINLFPDKDQICSGEQITVVNPTQGGTSHSWQVIRQSDNTVIDTRNFTAATNQVFTLNNNLPTAVNPDVFNIVYTVANANCSDQRTIPITVFENIIAGFNSSSFPVYTGAPVPVTFTNTSSPVNINRFTYDWEFGDASNPTTGSGSGPFTVNYNSPGNKTIRLTAINNAAQAAGLSCQSFVEQTIIIQVPPFEARFDYIPVSACFPSKIEITENFAVSGTSPNWRLVDDTGRVVGTSNSDKPIFDIINPGIYIIFLEVINPITGQVAFADNSGVGVNAMPGKAPIPIYPRPQSVFQVRPATVYVPNTELVTLNFSQPTNVAADEVAFLWNFGDSNEVIKQLLGQPNPTHFYKVKGNYTITMIMQETRSGLACADTSAVEIEAVDGGQISIPNAFTPDVSGPNGGIPSPNTVNDVFLPLMRGIDFDEPNSFIMQIYDRWGNLLFESRNISASEPLRGWDGYDKNGQLLPAGVYVYKLFLKFSDGQRTTKFGDVTLIR